jgi:hypothetical protein
VQNPGDEIFWLDTRTTAICAFFHGSTLRARISGARFRSAAGPTVSRRSLRRHPTGWIGSRSHAASPTPPFSEARGPATGCGLHGQPAPTAVSHNRTS